MILPVGQRTWRIRTACREILVELRPRGVSMFSRAHDDRRARSGPGTDVLLADLLFELGRGNRDVASLMEVFETSVRGPRPVSFGGYVARTVALTREDAAPRAAELARRVAAGEVSLSEVPRTFFDVVPEAAATSAAAASASSAASQAEDQQAEPEQFIGVELRGPDGKPLSGQRVRIELPDGQVQESYTGLDGKARVDGFTQGGSAKITLLDYDEKGYPLVDVAKGSASPKIPPPPQPVVLPADESTSA